MRLREEASTFRYRPLISILMPVIEREPEQLEQALDSVLGQIYQHWELCVGCNDTTGGRTKRILSEYERLDGRIKVVYLGRSAAGLSNAVLSIAAGEFAGVLGCCDELAPDALFEVVKALQEHADSDLIYSDEDRIDEKGNRSRPHFKPDWSPDLLLSTNYVSHLSVYRRSVLEDVGAFRKGFEGCLGYDLVLRVTERDGLIQHVPKVLYHRRISEAPKASGEGDEVTTRESARRALSEAMKRRGLEGSVEDGLLPDRFRLRFDVRGEPKVSIIIPTRDNVSLLKNCVESIERLSTYRNYEILIVDNDSVDSETVEYLASMVHRVVRFRDEFNYSRINNLAVAQAEGEYVLLLNDDTEVISADWLEVMLGHAQRPEVGAVGARLLYPDRRIQHAGVLVGTGNPWGPGIALHSHQYYPADSAGYAGTALTTTNYSAVTAACLLLRKSLFEEVGGLDEENLPVGFNDVDLCLRIRERGFLITYTPHAELYHHESASRGHGGGDPAEALYMRDRWGTVMDEDPYYNPNFSKGSGDFNLRADLLRPRVLRPEVEQESAVSFMNSLTTPREELKEYVMAQQGAARNSSRNVIVPASEDRNGSSPLLKTFEPLEDPGPQEDERPIRSFAAPVDREALRTEQLIWIFGSPRTGSTWLSCIMAELDNQKRWHEPYVGLLFGSFIYERLGESSKLLNTTGFIMGEAHRKVWLNSIKNFVVDGAMARYPRLRRNQYLVVKEPNGSVGAPLLLEATPESRLIFLIRDPRDVVASRLDAFRAGSWSAQQRVYSTVAELNAFTKHLAEEYVNVVSQVKRAYEAHAGRKTLIRYEDLRYDTSSTLAAMYEALGVEFDRARLEAAVAKHSWEQIPPADKGTGKFYRKAQPGGWKEDLTQEQVSLVVDVTRPMIREFYPPDENGYTFSG
ncbi:MAG TPA: glycosyltransferase [Rubrobacter sp.]|nr:glycosyltransferase [Rubrobacter sp.]